MPDWLACLLVALGVAGNMRYQIDRKFIKLDGSLSSLELTEIRKSDADTRPPDFPHQSGGQ